MQTDLIATLRNTAAGQEAESILRTCVHCGFCTATCPTYQLLGDELDGPRGRIYLMKAMMEGAPVTQKTLLHLDRCLECASCETTCPSGVRYTRLLGIGREMAERQAPRSLMQRWQRSAVRGVLLRPALFGGLLACARALRPLLPEILARRIPRAQQVLTRPAARHPRSLLVLDGCVQPALTPNTNAAAARVLDRLGISLRSVAGCCGALSYHTGAQADGLDTMRRNVDAWHALLEQGAEALLLTASGCGALVREYGHLLRHDAAYAAKAARVSAACRDLSEILVAEQDALAPLLRPAVRGRVAFHAPCSLQHAQRIVGVVETLLTRAGYELTPVTDAHLCCGSAGAYSILQRGLSQRLLQRKLQALQQGEPAQIATANVGCQTHLQGGSELPVRHWIELLDEALISR